MLAYRLNLIPLLLLVCVACEEAHEAARDAGDVVFVDSGSESGAAAGDAQTAPPGYVLCDGSERVRFGYASGGGAVDEGYFFLHPYGFRFLFIDGRCDFLLTEFRDAPGAVIRGQLDAPAAAEIEALLRLDALSEGAFIDAESCPDAGDTWLATADFFGNCTCDCDAPPALGQIFVVLEEVFAKLRARAAAASGEVELAAVMRDPESLLGAAPDWPFSWPVTEILNDALWEDKDPLRLRVLAGADAEVVRKLRSDARAAQRDKRLLVQSGDLLFELYARDRTGPELTAEIERFRSEVDPR